MNALSQQDHLGHTAIPRGWALPDWHGWMMTVKGKQDVEA